MKIAGKVITVVVMAVGISLLVVTADYLHKIFSYTSVLPVKYPSDRQINSYGREKFVRQALEFRTTEKANAELLQHFKIKRIVHHAPGVLLVCGENRKYMKGLYVDPAQYFEDTYASGVAISIRSSHIGVAEVKKRIYGDLKGLATAHEMYANDYVDGTFRTEPNGL
jgi:hypothetical protein